MWVIVGLGNPGEEYAKTRHNIGFRCVSELARRYNLEFSAKRAHARIAEGVHCRAAGCAGEAVYLHE